MIRIIPRWRIGVTLHGGRQIEFWMSDDHVENVLKHVATMQFSKDVYERAIQVIVGLDEPKA